MKKTFQELQEVDQLIGSLYEKDKTLRESKFGYVYKRFSKKNYIPVVEELTEKIQDIRIENSLEDPQTKQILQDPSNPRGFKFSKEGLKRCIELERQLSKEFDKREIEIIPYISSYMPELTDDQKEMLTGLIL